MTSKLTLIAGIGMLLSSYYSVALAQTKAHDPGPRPAASTDGSAIAGLTANQAILFGAGLTQFKQQDQVIADGLGPRFNMDSCAICHSQPAVGGSGPKANPQYQFVQGANHGVNKVPFFISADGPTREARFPKTAKGTPDGGVHDLFVISGMKGAETCKIVQPDFDGNKNNVIFRIPTPVLGAGLIEQIRDTDILANLATEGAEKTRLKVKGRVNIVVPGNTQTKQSRIQGETNNNGNDGTIARFGWKAQNKSLLLFAGEAYNVEIGISNELFQTEREEQCPLTSTPNDTTNFDNAGKTDFSLLSDIEKFAAFMRFLAPPVASNDTPGGAASITAGKALFSKAGCGLCHTPMLRTDPQSAIAALANQPVNLYSDLALHEMGNGLADGISQGQATGSEFRTAPLWGLGKRLFFLHDGRATDLVAAIQAHASSKSEANEVIKQYNKLRNDEKQNILNFLRSL